MGGRIKEDIGVSDSKLKNHSKKEPTRAENYHIIFSKAT